MSAETLKLITQTSLAVLVLGVLVWALHNWNLERERQADMQEKQRSILVDTVVKGIQNGREERRDLNEQIANLTSQMIVEDRVDKRILDLLQANLEALYQLRSDLNSQFSGIGSDVKEQTRAIQRGLELPVTQ